jgi:hypothetical protein
MNRASRCDVRLCNAFRGIRGSSWFGWSPDSIKPPHDCDTDRCSREQVTGELVVTGRDGAASLEPGEHTFDRIAPFAERHVAAEQLPRLVVVQVVGVIALIGVQARGRPDCTETAEASAISAAIEVCKAAR